ncbi:MAG: VanZ family protein [Ornithinimicrobium sp.]
MLDRLAPGFAVVGVVALFVLVMAVPFIATGSQSARSGFVRAGKAAAVLSYAAAVLAYTVLPLPSGEAMRQRCASGDGGAGIQLMPFHFLTEVGAGESSRGLVLLADPALWQVVLNVVLFVPLGFLLWRLLPGRAWAALGVAVGCSLGIEMTQGTGLWFLYDCAYRVFDVDDVLANGLGAACGMALAAGHAARRAPAAD